MNTWAYVHFRNVFFYKRYRDALVDYEAAEKLKGNYTMMEHPFSFYKGLCYLGLNEFDSAMFEFNRTIEAERKTGDSYIHFMGLVLSRYGIHGAGQICGCGD